MHGTGVALCQITMDENNVNEFETETPTITRASVPMRAIMADLANALVVASAQGIGTSVAYASLIASER